MTGGDAQGLVLSRYPGGRGAGSAETVPRSRGRSFTDILRQIRMRRATWLLKNTDLSISQIAAEVRRTDASHFNRNFRKEFNMLPTEYRQLFAPTQG